MNSISSRTPEGDPAHCPVCGHDCRLDPSWPGRDGPCPSCGHLLWFEPPDLEVCMDSLGNLLLRMGELRFGKPPEEARWALSRIRTRADLEAFTDRLLKASSWDEVLDE